MRRCTPRFRRVRSRFVPSMNSDHRRPPQHTRNGGSPALRLRMYGHIDTALGRPLRLLSFSLRGPPRRLRPGSLLPKCRDYARDRNREPSSTATSYCNTKYGELGLSPATTWTEFQAGSDLFRDVCLFEMTVAIRTQTL